LHLALETPQCIFQRLTLLDDDFSHLTFTPNPVRIGNVRKPGLMPVSTAMSIACQPTQPKCSASLMQAWFLNVLHPEEGRSMPLLLVNSVPRCQAIFMSQPGQPPVPAITGGRRCVPQDDQDVGTKSVHDADEKQLSNF
jgi:hypothetical protein